MTSGACAWLHTDTIMDYLRKQNKEISSLKTLHIRLAEFQCKVFSVGLSTKEPIGVHLVAAKAVNYFCEEPQKTKRILLLKSSAWMLRFSL